MHNNFYFLRHLVPALANKLEHTILTACYSQNKDELLLVFEQETKEPFYLKAHLKSAFSCLSFPANYHRAKRNSINLFNSLLKRTIISLKPFKNERAFAIEFNNQQQLIFKLYGNQSNIILVEHNKVIDLFKHNLKRDNTIEFHSLGRVLDISITAFKENNWDVQKTIPTLDKTSALDLSSRLHADNNAEQSFKDFFKELESCRFYLDENKNGYRLSLLKSKETISQFTNPILAINSFFEKQVKYKIVYQLKNTLTANLNKQLIKSNNYVRKLSQKLVELSSGSSNQQKADILMANLHTISKGVKSVELFNFYTNTTSKIAINPLQSPQKNAERYYRKAKNEAKEIRILTKNIQHKKNLIKELKSKLMAIENSIDYKFLQNQLPKKAIALKEEPKAFKEFRIDNFVILVGKNAKHNDTLTLKIAKKDDLWLHAKDVSGSHVVIKQIPGRNYPDYIIEKAAQLAAFYSKRKTDSLCPVLYTPKKFVRKKKGTPAGAMFVEKEKVILVEPKNCKTITNCF